SPVGLSFALCPLASRASTVSSAVLRTSNVSPPAAGTHLPPIRSLWGEAFRKEATSGATSGSITVMGQVSEGIGRPGPARHGSICAPTHRVTYHDSGQPQSVKLQSDGQVIGKSRVLLLEEEPSVERKIDGTLHPHLGEVRMEGIDQVIGLDGDEDAGDL